MIYESKILHELWAFMQTPPTHTHTHTHPPAILYKWAKRLSSDHRNFAVFKPNTFKLGNTLPSVCKARILFQYCTIRISWFVGSFLLGHPLQFLSFSPVAIPCVYVPPQITTDIPEPLFITQKLTLTVKRISMQSIMSEDVWVDGVMYRLSLGHSVEDCGQHPRPIPASLPPPAMQTGQIIVYHLKALKEG